MSRAFVASRGRPLFLFWPIGTCLAVAGTAIFLSLISIPKECLHACFFKNIGQVQVASSSFTVIRQIRDRHFLNFSNVCHLPSSRSNCCTILADTGCWCCEDETKNNDAPSNFFSRTSWFCVAHWNASVHSRRDNDGDLKKTVQSGKDGSRRFDQDSTKEVALYRN